jgi:two-component sensor histidine kinase
MPFGGPDSERALILLRKRNAEVASRLLTEAGFAAKICDDAGELIAGLKVGAGFAVLSEDVAAESEFLDGIEHWMKSQEAWSDFPIIMLTGRSDVPGRNSTAAMRQEKFGNISFLEQPFHPTTLVSLATTALRSRRRQYEARALLARYELLARELQHRTKNLLSVIISIASASLSEGGGGGEALVARLHSLAKAQDLIFEQGGSGAQLGHIVARIVDSFGSRVTVDGPTVFLKASIAQGFALIVHELATNAAKYGALTKPSGRVLIRWCLNAGVEIPTVTFTWQERGGPAAAAPKHRGFGTILLERAVASAGAPPRFEYAIDGFTYHITALCR